MFCGDDRDGAVIPNPMRQLRMYRWRGSRNRWHRISPDRDNGEDEIPPSTIELVSWNVSFDAPLVATRMAAMLRHLEKVVFKCRGGRHRAEVNALVGLETILKDEWVREHFFVTPADTSKWPTDPPARYGNVTLVEKSIPVVDAHILEFGLSAMQRTGVMYDVILRIINTHLESLPSGDDARPEQLKLLSKFLRQVAPGVRGGIISGDMNPIGPKDAGVPGALGLKDAWRKGDTDERGFTWGEQPRSEFPAGRFDKILYLPRKGYRVDEPQRIGMGLKVSNERVPNGLWMSDHCGLWTKVQVLR
ncbi:Endonuclease/exonuclease/phosphatase [Mycena leptocephala]|nr:Endonuclease/exonuclease/phosphatase [Mycena leptocephala]